MKMTRKKQLLSRKNHSNSKAKTTTWRWWEYTYTILLTGLMVVGLFYWQLHASWSSFAQISNLDWRQLWSIYQQATATTPSQSEGRTNILLLGSDQMEFREQNYALTDTMMLVSIDWRRQQIYLLPLPRDMVSPTRQVKINALYALLTQNNPESGLEHTALELGELLGVPIHYQLLVTMSDVSDFLTLLDGIEINVVNSFTDYQFPKSDVDIRRVSDPKLLYETVTFTSGWQHLDAKRVLQFMRSRHSVGVEGSDYARSRRQQQVLQAVGNKVGQLLLADLKQYDLQFLAKIWQFYQTHFAQQLSFETALSLVYHNLKPGNLPTVHTLNLAIYPGDAQANLHESNRGGFSLLISNLMGLRQEVARKLNLPE